MPASDTTFIAAIDDIVMHAAGRVTARNSHGIVSPVPGVI